MNPFVNPNKRSVTLPDGCKDLIDVLRHPTDKTDMANMHFGKAGWGTGMVHLDAASFARKFIYLVLFQARQDNVTELVIGVESPGANVPIREKKDNAWHDASTFPAYIRPRLIDELARMAHISTKQTPAEGVLDLDFGKVRLRWTVSIASAEGECRLTRVED